MRWIAFLLVINSSLAIAVAEEPESIRLWEPFDPFGTTPPEDSGLNSGKRQIRNETATPTPHNSSWSPNNGATRPEQNEKSSWNPDDPFGIRNGQPKSDGDGIKGRSAAERTKGTWRDPKCLTIQGAKRFEAEEIRRGLLNSFEVWEALHPLAAPHEYPKLLAERCSEGYRHAGFSEVNVEGRFSDDYNGVVLTIQEGPESFCGNVKVEGAIHFQPHELANWLTNKQPQAGSRPTSFVDTEQGTVATWVLEDGSEAKLEAAAWEIAMPVRGDELGQKKLEEMIARGLAELGLPWAKFEFKLAADKKPNFKELLINIVDEGPLAIAEEIEIVGNQRDSAEDIIKYLGVHRGVVLRESLRIYWYQKLWMSGRFISQNVELVSPTPFGDPAKLRITVSEHEPVTPLNKPLNEIETMMMKCRDWILSAKERNDDLVIRVSGSAEGCIVASADNRALISFDSFQFPWMNENGPVVRNIAMSLNSGKLVFASAECSKVFAIDVTDWRPCIQLGIHPRRDPENPVKDKFALRFGIAATKATNNLWSFNIAPAAMIDLAHRGGDLARIGIADDLLTMEDNENKQLMQIKTSTGELLCYKQRLSKDSNVWFEFGFQKGAFEPEFARTNSKLSNHLSEGESAYRPDHPISSAVEYFLTDDLVKTLTPEDRVQKTAKLVRKATIAGLLHPVDHWFLDPETYKKDDAGKFKVPAKPGTTPDEVSSISSIVALGMAAISDCGVEEDSWPAILLRVAAEISTHRTKYVNADLRTLINCKDFGPLGHWAAAEMLRSGGPDTAAYFAKLGLTKLSTEQFVKDCEPLGNPNTHAGKFACHIAMILRDLTDEELNGLGALLLGDHGEVFTKVVEELHNRRDRPVEEALPAAAQIAWESSLRTLIENRLRQLAGETVATKPAEPADKKRE